MTTTPRPDPARTPLATGRPRVLLADRGDALVSAMAATMRARFDVVGRLDAELSRTERLLVAAATFRPHRRAWTERFYKSGMAVGFRSRRARAGLADTSAHADVVLQTHALFESTDTRTVLYVDCTHRQSMEQWSDWNPLHGRALERWLARERRQYHRAAHVFAFSQETACSLVQQYDVAPDRVSVVGAGLNFAHLPDLGTTPTGPPTVLFVGNDFVRKGGPQLLEAFATLRTRTPGARLRIVGTPHAAPEQDGVEHLGRVHDRDRMSRLYAEADVFCLPSAFDPYPGALLEAMAHALPCVVTPTCGVPEIVVEGTTALVVEPGPRMVADLADALETLLRHPDRAAEMGRAGRRRVEEGFLWTHVVDRMAPVIDRLAGVDARPLHPVPAVPAPPRPTTDPLPRSPTMSQTEHRPEQPSTFTSDRPWGGFQQLSLNESTTVKVITVAPDSRLSLQRHEHRSELWQVLDGPMDVEVDGRSWTARHGEHVWVPAGCTHRMGNPGAERARVLEVAFGTFDEDDIERLQDDYDR